MAWGESGQFRGYDPGRGGDQDLLLSNGSWLRHLWWSSGESIVPYLRLPSVSYTIPPVGHFFTERHNSIHKSS